MKRIYLILSLIAVILLTSVTAFALDGDGSEETPFIITESWELELVTDFPDCHFKLGNDIELEGTWIPLCKQTSDGYFKGVFDGAGYTISNLVTDGTMGGLFKHNKGTIKNLNVAIAEEGMTGSGGISHYNTGTISNCVVNGIILTEHEYTGGICAYNKRTVEKCKFEGIVENNYDSFDYTGGICGYNSDSVYNSYALITSCAVKGNVNGGHRTGGICGYNTDKISNCYFMGSLTGGGPQGGICSQSLGESTSYDGYISNCFTVPTFDGDSIYGISYLGRSYFSKCFYDKTVSGLSSTDYGTPKSTVAMKMKQTYADWDFDTVWGINKSINNGYPYLLWEYSDVDESDPYTINSITIKDASGNVLEEIPDDSFYCEVSVTKNDNSKTADSVVIATYDENGVLIGFKYVSALYYRDQTVTVGTTVSKGDKTIGKIKCFVWDSVFGMKPLSTSVSFE